MFVANAWQKQLKAIDYVMDGAYVKLCCPWGSVCLLTGNRASSSKDKCHKDKNN